MDIISKSNFVLEHILYEMQMFLLSFTYDLELLHKDHKILIGNLIWVDRLIHLRNLIDFFTEHRTYPTDMKYHDLLENFKPIEIDKISKRIITNYIDKSVCHLTFDRTNYNYKEQTYLAVDSIHESIIIKIKEFINALPGDLKHKYIDEYNDNDIRNLIDSVKILLP